MRTLLICALTTAASLVAATAQQRADAAARTSGLQRIQGAASAQAERPAAASEYVTEADMDLGEQQAVSAREGGIGIYGSANSGLFYTSNPSLSKTPGKGDMYFVGGGEAGIYPEIAPNLYLDGYFSTSVFQYAQFSSLNFTVMTTGGGLDYVIEQLGGLTASVNYEYQRYLDGDTLDEFYVNNAISVGLSKQFLISDNQSIQLGWNSAFSVTATPSVARRNEHDFWLGWRWRIIDPIELQTYYILSLYNYPNDDRTDATNNFGATVSYYFTNWARVSASAGFSVNSSTESEFDYTMATVGGTLGLDIRF